ncbi:DUF1648 domain-containing protein [Nocardioides sp. GY 10113]|uniref:DUF1648 domain-containing protein n=1 Tax=Nocardioides sp. GY 10113 TaxID=2569761 RepID=UPI0010A87EDF|nr:DUF1648 domain-containing protein [Nocardioides sp. GY 10113]TIC88202.1 DUF1648 domain-containing protein [Nocardioides sp. GY 10113]
MTRPLSRRSVPTAAFAGSCLLYAAAWVAAAVALPDRVPVHFGFSGEVDRWSGRGELLVGTALVGLLVAGVLALVAFAPVPASMVNVPHKEWWTATPERAERMRAMARADALWLGTATMLLLTCLLVVTTAVADDPEPSLGPWFFAAIGIFLAAVTLHTAYSFVVRYRPDRDGGADG